MQQERVGAAAAMVAVVAAALCEHPDTAQRAKALPPFAPGKGYILEAAQVAGRGELSLCLPLLACLHLKPI